MNDLDKLIEESSKDVDNIFPNISEEDRAGLKMLFGGMLNIAFRLGKAEALHEMAKEFSK